MEQLLHYVWKHKAFPLKELHTTEGQPVEIVNPGFHNTDAGPDFFNAKVRVGGTLWVGNVEIHTSSSDWYRHRHDSDPAYNNVILHVATVVDCDICGPDGQSIPQLQLDVPDDIRLNYESLMRLDMTPRCAAIVKDTPRLIAHNWLSALQVERLEERSAQVMARHKACGMDWETTFFVTLARTLGFGVNGDAFELWAGSIPPSAIGKHRDDEFQIEAVFFGQAAMLDPDSYNARKRDELARDPYFTKLRNEYLYLQKKFTLKPIDHSVWKFLRLRPQNFPTVRIAQMAALYSSRQISLSKVINADDSQLQALLTTAVSPYWQTHYTFASAESKPSQRPFSTASISLITVNCIAPLLFTYGRYKGDEKLCERALSLLEQLRPEDNKVVRAWADAGFTCDSAADSQALLQLNNRYCEPHDCLRCRFGYEFIRRTPGFLRERDKENATAEP